MTLTIEAAKQAIYDSMMDDNADIDSHIANLKTALAAAGEKAAVFDTEKLAQKNRSGRKMMQAYFKKRGVVVEFTK
jgi:hypothetical protein